MQTKRKRGAQAAQEKKERSLKKTFRDSMMDSLERLDEEKGRTRQELLIDAIVDKGISGDARAFDIINGIVGARGLPEEIIVRMEEPMDAFGE